MNATFNSEQLAREYASSHQEMDPGVRRVFHLRAGAPEREIRLLEINELLVDREIDEVEPIEFGIDRGTDHFHTLIVVDVTPSQWDRIEKKKLKLPAGWSLDGATELLETVG